MYTRVRNNVILHYMIPVIGGEHTYADDHLQHTHRKLAT